MKTAYSMATSKEFVGAELELAYAELVDGYVNGGFQDGGKDIIPNDKSIPAFQVKSSARRAIEFLARSIRFRRFIPVCVGEPPKTREELVACIRSRGCWVGYDVPKREEAYAGIELVRAKCSRT